MHPIYSNQPHSHSVESGYTSCLYNRRDKIIFSYFHRVREHTKWEDNKEQVWDTYIDYILSYYPQAEAIVLSDAYYGERYEMYTWNNRLEYGGVSPVKEISTYRFVEEAPDKYKKYITKLPDRTNPNSTHLISCWIVDVLSIRQERSK